MQQHPSSEINANQRIARISTHLDPPNLQMENAATVNHLNCRAKGGTAGYIVATLRAAGGIGQHLAMLMKMNPLVSVLHLYDVINTPDVVMRGFLGHQQLDEALTGMELVIIPASVPRKPGMTRDDEIESYDGFLISGSSGHAHGNDA
ncbi:malate dehydrogenase, glyoxysomal-like [Malus sylvestris]|uniref:malate dehydrogenase, glyoxysomal-like n=1 Tax=Malus sylvestris TaxID=3752 RepID=UPI0021ACF5B7|nr:malate dehydrogenase, glyoxysomal-like [Malus sylvestris]